MPLVKLRVRCIYDDDIPCGVPGVRAEEFVGERMIEPLPPVGATLWLSCDRETCPDGLSDLLDLDVESVAWWEDGDDGRGLPEWVVDLKPIRMGGPENIPANHAWLRSLGFRPELEVAHAS